MRTDSYLLTIILTCLAPVTVQAQERDRTDSLEVEIRLLRQRLDSLQAAWERFIRDEGRVAAEAPDELAALRAAAREAAGGGETAVDTASQQQSRTRNLRILNPEISVTGDVVGNFTAPVGEGNRFSATPREFEFSFQSALDPYTRTKIFVTREEDFEIAGFPEEEPEESGGFEIEEGYMYWVGLPGGLGAKLGKFRQEIGLYNRWHTHALLEIERPLATVTFLGEDGLIQTGGAVTLPSLTVGPATETVVFEVTRADNDALFDGGHDISYLGRFQSFLDLGPSTYLQLGATGVYGENDEADLKSKLLGVDVSFRWAPPGRALYQDLQLKGEWYFVDQEVAGADEDGHGGYGQLNYRLNRRWIIGVRADYVDAFGTEPNIVQIAPSITWWQSEWVRLRLQYNHVRPEGGAGNHTILLQSVWAVGPHKHETY